jgi:hypothetical protein
MDFKTFPPAKITAVSPASGAFRKKDTHLIDRQPFMICMTPLFSFPCFSLFQVTKALPAVTNI